MVNTINLQCKAAREVPSLASAWTRSTCGERIICLVSTYNAVTYSKRGVGSLRSLGMLELRTCEYPYLQWLSQVFGFTSTAALHGNLRWKLQGIRRMLTSLARRGSCDTKANQTCPRHSKARKLLAAWMWVKGLFAVCSHSSESLLFPRF